MQNTDADPGVDFGYAIRALKRGCRVARQGWNGKGMWLSLSGSLQGTFVPWEQFWSQHNREFAQADESGHAKVQPCITMKTAGGEIQMGWLASQSDMLANDWYVVP